MIKEAFDGLIHSDQVTQKTREVLEQRKNKRFSSPLFFSMEEFELLQAICDELLAQTDNRLVDVAGLIDERLNAKTGPGWRYDQLPEDGIAYKTGLKGIIESVLLLSHQNFTELSAEEKKDLLKTVQQGNAEGETWRNFSGKLFFELMLTEATENFYSHPNAQAEINYVGFADANGWEVPQLEPEKYYLS